MFKIRRIYDDLPQANQAAIHQVQAILREQFPLLNQASIDNIPDLIRNPLNQRFSSILCVAEDHKEAIKGFSLFSHEPKLRFCYLDYISAAKSTTGGGIGGALYEHIREEALSMGVIGIFFECLPDDPKLCSNPLILKGNKARLRFYEKYGARPIINTAYETPVKPGGDNPPYLVFDDLGQNRPLGMAEAKTIVRGILEGKYGMLCSKEYIETVVQSFQDDPVRLREPRYIKQETRFRGTPVSGKLRRIALVVNDRHNIHHVKEKGYVESPVRIRAILKELETTGLFKEMPPEEFPESHIRLIHDNAYITYFKRVCQTLEPGKSVYPYVFPIRNSARPPKELAIRVGYYCIDTFTPLNQNAFLAAKRAVDCALTAASKILEGYHLAYALVRPPGHHAERRSFGGFCYFNNAAVAAHFLTEFGKVAILDIDYHHGNGQQMIFYERSDVLTVSIHGHPRFAFPYFSGFEDEMGSGAGTGFNVNYPLQEDIGGEQYLKTLDRAFKKVTWFRPTYLIVCLGLDTSKRDPTGSWHLVARDYEQIGKRIGNLHLPTLVAQEGGYNTRVLGVNARHFFTGLWAGMFPA